MIEPTLRLRRLSLADMLDEAATLYREHFLPFWSVALFVSIPSFVLDLGGSGGGYAGLFQGYARRFAPSNSLGPVVVAGPNDGVILVVGMILSLVFVPFTSGALVRAATSVALGSPITFTAVIKGTLARYWALWGSAFLIGLTYMASIAIVTIPLVIFAVIRWSLRYPAMFAEDTGTVDGFRRSAALVRGSWWRVLGILLLMGIIVAVLGFIMGLVAGLVSFAFPLEIRKAGTAILSTLAVSLVLPIAALIVTLLYVDLRVRNEDLDLQVMAGQSGLPTQ